MNEIRCPKCRAVIGEYVDDGYTESSIGLIRFQRAKKNNRASNTWLRVGKNEGTLCKRCAKELFPDNVRYYVTIIEGTRIGTNTCAGGVDNCGTFATKKDAVAEAKRMNARHNGCTYKVTTKSI